MRIVSLLPSATEFLCRIGGEGLLVGRSHGCDDPPGVESLAALTAPAAGGGDGGDFPEGAWPGLRAGPLYLDAAMLGALAPDVILTGDPRLGGGVDPAAVFAAAAGLPRPPAVVSLDGATVEGVLDDALTIGWAAGLQDRAVAEVVRLRERMHRAQDHVNPYEDGPGAVFLEWADPPVVAGLWTAQLVERAGARHPLNPTRVASERVGSASGPQQAYRVAGPPAVVSGERLAASEPEVLVVCPRGLDLARAWEEAERLSRREWWGRLPAVRRGRVAVVDGRRMFHRPGPRLAEAFEWLVGWVQGVGGLMPEGFPWRAWG